MAQKPYPSEGRFRNRLAGGTALAALFCGGGASAADDPHSAASASNRVDEIVVTATKRETRLQDTPIAITAASSETLEQANVEAARDLNRITPGLNFAETSGIETPVSLRGISSGGLGLGGDSPVAIYLDGVYLAQPHSSTFALADIERVEVLRGPQGTLYGQNSTAGAIKIITTTPGPDVKAMASLELGSYNLRVLKGSASGPVIEDKLFIKIAGTTRQRDGLYRNYYTGLREGGQKETTLNGALRFTPSDTVDLVLRGDIARSEIPPVRQVLFSSAGAEGRPVPCPLLDCNLVFTNGQPAPVQDFKNGGVSLTAQIDLGGAELTSISAYRQQNWFFLIDNSYGPAQLFPVQNIQHEEQYTQEFNLASQGNGPLQWVVGGFYLREKGSVFVPLMFRDTLLVPDINGDGLADNLQATTWSEIKQNAFALYGEANYAVADALRITAGLRYGISKRDLRRDSLSRILPSPQPPVIGAFQNLPPRSAATVHLERSGKWKYLIPRLIVDFKLSPTVMTYASISRGYKNGGFDFVSTNPGPYEPEKLWTYEAGVKAEMWDRRARFNLAAFRSDYTGLQLTVQDALGNRTTINAADSRIYGVEFEYLLRPVDGLSIDGFVTYTDAKFLDFLTDVSGFGLNPAANCLGGRVVDNRFCDLSGNRVVNAPKWTFSANAQYTLRLGDAGALTPRVSFTHRSKTFFTKENIAPAMFDHVNLLDARLTYETEDERWAISFYAENLTNFRYVTGAGFANISRSSNAIAPLPNGATRIIGSINYPRTYGVSVKFQM